MALVERTHATILIQARADEFRSAIVHTDAMGRLDFKIEGETQTRRAIVKNVEQDVLKRELLHITLQEVSEEDMVKVDVPVVATGTPSSATDGDYVLMAATDHVKVRGKLGLIPERIEVNVSHLEPGHHIAASDIQMPAGVELMSSPDATLFSLRSSTVTEQPESAQEVSEESTAEQAAV